MKSSDNGNWEYRTRCRQCGEKHEWYIGSKESVKYETFFELMNGYLETPIQIRCKVCKEHTVHDIIAFSHPHDDAKS